MIDHKATLTRDVTALLEDISGETIEANASQASFLELGFDSLLLGQVAQGIQKTYNVKLTFRQLLGAYPSIDALVTHLASVVPAPTVIVPPSSITSSVSALAAAPVQVDLSKTIASVSTSAAPSMGGGQLEALMRDQLATMQAIFSQQLQALSPSGAAPTVATTVPTASVATTGQAIAVRPAMPSPLSSQSATDEAEGEGRFKIYRAGAASTGSSLSPAQQALVSDLVRRTDTKFATSKARAQASRRVLADPRSASGFRAEWKELIYPIIAERSKGSKLYDADGNTLVDLVNGYGQTAFGHAPDFVTSAISAQMEKGFAIGPQTPLAAEVAEMFCAITGNERATFCNTGSEAVMAGMRIARAVTGRNKVVFFGGAYHGQFDEVLAKGLGKRAKGPGAAPVAPGIPREAVSNMVVLSYDNPESLAWVKANIDDIAAVLVETVQSRHPALVPTAFIRELRDVTAASGAALIFDEVVTGFRVHPGGMQAVLGIKADLATYGKVVGGGMPIGVLAGTARFMDALDGGYWQFGDESVPEVAPTFFAGTFVRHPLVLAAAKAVLEHVKAHGSQLQDRLAATTAGLVERLNTALTVRGIQTRVERYSSWFYMNPAQEDPLASLLYPLMRSEGVHIYEGFPCFLTTAHSIADIDVIVVAFEAALDQLQRAGILSGGASIDAMIAPPLALTMAAATTLPDRVPLTEPQQEIYLAAQLGDAASTAFNESVSVRLTGEIEHEAMARALNDVVARHDALRGRFGDTGEMMDVAPALAIALPLVDLSSASDTDAALAQRLASDAAQPFDLAQGPLVRAQLVRLSTQSYVFVFTAHHIICDGWSINVILNELAANYAARRRGTTASFETLLPYRQYALDLKNKPAATATDAFWSGMYKTIPPPLELPSDRARTLDRSWRGATTSAMIERDILRSIKLAAGKQGASLFVVLFSALQALIGRLSGSSDVALAVPMAGQTAIEDKVLVGHCVNFLPVRVAFDPEQPFAQHLKTVNATMMQAYEHQDTTLGRIVRTLDLKRGVGRTPIADVQFNLEKLGDGLAFDGVPATITPNPKSAVNFDLFFNFIEGRDGLRVDVDYNTDLYDAATIERWIGHLRILLSAIATDSQTAIARLPLMDATHTRWLISDLNQTREAYQSGQRVDEIISTQARRTPHAIAVTFGDQSLTYADLEAASNKLASAIRNVVPKPGARVALAVHRSLDMLLALLAIMKAGHTYVPLDPTHPKTRLRQTLEAARVSLLITNDVDLGDIAPNGVAILDLNQRRDEISWGSSAPLNVMTPPDASAYVIFTSGSTGVPKGVDVGHRAVVNFLASMAKTPGFTARDRLLAVTTVCFDISGLELFLPLTVGGTVVIASREAVADGFQLVEMISQQRISVVQATPSLWQMLVEAGFKPRSGVKMLVGGEPLPRDLADLLTANGGELWNLYGPTETTIWSSTCRVGPGAIHIGSPIANTELYILDPTDQLAPIGVAGELYIGGDGLARGYFDRPDLTTASFRMISLGGDVAERLYRTGDIGRRLADGTIQLFGRRDSQVKLRGYRIELEDIEAVLRTADAVAHAAVGMMADDPTAPRLIGYIVPRVGQTIERGALAAHVGRHLPDYMVPSKWVILDALPMTGNGKLERKALPLQPGRAEAGAATTAVAPAVVPEPIVDLPRSGIEERIAAVWREVLQVPSVARDVSILAYGADSLHIFRIAARLQNQGLRLQARHLLTLPTIAQQAAHVGTIDDTPDTAAVPPSLQAYRRGQNRTQR
ncbi:MAG: amino acid adenylation domain-containing protein [Hyphomicrobiaceae bacterium]